MGRIILWLILSVFLIGVLLLFAAKIDVVVSGRGIIIPEGEIKLVQPLEGGVISSIKVRVGDAVRKGELLLEIDPSSIDPDFKAKKENLERIKGEMGCIEELLSVDNSQKQGCYNTEDPSFARFVSMRRNMEDQVNAKRTQISQLQTQRKAKTEELSATNKLLNNETERFNKLQKVKDIISLDEYKRSQDSVLNLRKEAGSLKHTAASIDYQIEELGIEIRLVEGGTMESLQKELADLSKTYASLKGEVEQTAFRYEKQQILSPVDGVVNTLKVHTVGGVVTSAQELLTVVPTSSKLVAKVQILNKDIGYIKTGEEAVLKMDTFDFQKYGKIGGNIIHISADSIENEQLGRVYEVYIEPDNLTLIVEGKLSHITSGMSMTAELKVGKRRVIEFFIYPAIKYLDEGLNVR